MSTNEMNNQTPETEAELSYADKCAAIISKFNDKSMPINPWDFKTMLFHCVYDAYIHRDDCSVTEEDVSMMWFLWDILDDVSELVGAKDSD